MNAHYHGANASTSPALRTVSVLARAYGFETRLAATITDKKMAVMANRSAHRWRQTSSSIPDVRGPMGGLFVIRSARPMMRYPCSYMIYSDDLRLAFAAKGAIYQRMWQVCKPARRKYARLTLAVSTIRRRDPPRNEETDCLPIQRCQLTWRHAIVLADGSTPGRCAAVRRRMALRSQVRRLSCVVMKTALRSGSCRARATNLTAAYPSIRQATAQLDATSAVSMGRCRLYEAGRP